MIGVNCTKNAIELIKLINILNNYLLYQIAKPQQEIVVGKKFSWIFQIKLNLIVMQGQGVRMINNVKSTIYKVLKMCFHDTSYTRQIENRGYNESIGKHGTKPEFT